MIIINNIRYVNPNEKLYLYSRFENSQNKDLDLNRDYIGEHRFIGIATQPVDYTPRHVKAEVNA